MTLHRKKPHSVNWNRLAAILACALGVTAGRTAHAGTPPTPLKVGQTAKTTLQTNKSHDYVVSLSKGSYRLVWDAQRVDGKDSNLMGVVELLKPNGVVIEAQQLNLNVLDVTTRVGTVLKVAKPFVARFRVMCNDAPFNSWFTVVPVKGEKRVPFGWGQAITPARISADNGVGGSLAPNTYVVHSITLPKGNWSVSLGLELPAGENSNLMGEVDQLDTLGFTTVSRLVNLNEINTQARAEGVIRVSKPTAFLLRVHNGTTDKTYKYDVTISKAE